MLAAAPVDHRSLTVVLMSAELWFSCCFIPNFNAVLACKGALMEVSRAHRDELLRESNNLQTFLLFHLAANRYEGPEWHNQSSTKTHKAHAAFITLLPQHIFINPLTPMQKVKWYFGEFQLVLMEFGAARVRSLTWLAGLGVICSYTQLETAPFNSQSKLPTNDLWGKKCLMQ